MRGNQEAKGPWGPTGPAPEAQGAGLTRERKQTAC